MKWESSPDFMRLTSHEPRARAGRITSSASCTRNKLVYTITKVSAVVVVVVVRAQASQIITPKPSQDEGLRMRCFLA